MQRYALLRPNTHLLGRWHEELGQLFSDLFDPSVARYGSRSRLFATGTLPLINLWEDEANLYASCELPGVRQEDIEVLVNGRELTIKSERKPLEDEQLTFHHRERSHGSFRRIVHLNQDVDAETVSASLEDGVLALTLPKAHTARRIEIHRLDH